MTKKNNGATLTKADIEARTLELVTKLRAVEDKREAKKAKAKQLRDEIKDLETEITELREEIATGMLAPSKRQASLDLKPMEEPVAKPKRKRATKKASKGAP